MIDEARAAARAVESLSAVVDRYRETMTKMEADIIRMTRSIDDMNGTAQGRENVITSLKAQLGEYYLPGWNGALTREEVQIVIDMRKGRVVVHALPATYEAAIAEAAALIDEARERCRPKTTPMVGMDGRDMAGRPGIDPRQFVKPAVVGDTDMERPNGVDLRPVWNPATETKEHFANRRHDYDERQTGKRAAMAISMPVAPRVERKVAADLNQALEPYRDSEPGEHQCVIDAINEC